MSRETFSKTHIPGGPKKTQRFFNLLYLTKYLFVKDKFWSPYSGGNFLFNHVNFASIPHGSDEKTGNPWRDHVLACPKIDVSVRDLVGFSPSTDFGLSKM